MATMEQREEQLDELSERYCRLEKRLELEREELDSFREENKRLRKALATSQADVLLLLDQVDYTAGRCQVNEMVGAVLPTEVIVLIKAHIASDQRLAALGQELVIKEDKLVQCQKRAIKLVWGGECDAMSGAEVRQMLVDEFGEETVAALGEKGKHEGDNDD